MKEKLKTGDYPSVIPGPVTAASTSSWNLLDMQILHFHLEYTESETLESGGIFPGSPPQRLALMFQRPEFCHPITASASYWQAEWEQHDWLKPKKIHPLPYGHTSGEAYLNKNEILAGGGKQSKKVD